MKTFFVEAYMTPGKVWLVEVEKLCLEKYKVVGDYINTMKTTFDFNFDSYDTCDNDTALLLAEVLMT